ncbi:MAG: hypothetical protein WCF61_00945 [Terriglobales bacterium]
MKVILATLLVIMASAMVLAQGVTQGANPTSSGAAGSVAPTVDVLGAHQNYGRGCAGCHAPHSGAWGEGGGTQGAPTDKYTGVNALFGQDMGPLWGKTFDFSDITNTGSANSYEFVTAANGNPTTMTTQQYADMRGAVMCLACHDGAVARGAMMQNWAYEEQIGALPTSYGSAKIPTLLGADGTTNIGSSTDGGNYNNDHPIGENATLQAVLGSYYGNATNGIVWTISTAGSITSIAYYGQYSRFVTSYGAPALLQGPSSYPTPVNANNVPYLVCTTCHDQHSMNVYAASASSPIAGNPSGTYAKYFFINGPYNPDTVTIPLGDAASTAQFCRQCHFVYSNEANGGTLPTAF